MILPGKKLHKEPRRERTRPDGRTLPPYQGTSRRFPKVPDRLPPFRDGLRKVPDRLGKVPDRLPNLPD
jgi:hypothetical protein